MKKLLTIFLCTSLILAGCDKPEPEKPAPVDNPEPKPEPEPEPEPEPDPEPEPLNDDTHINNTELQPGMNGVGLVRDASTGKGIPGVPVSDGYKFTVTDENGVYQMQLDARTRNVYITVPAAYKIPLDDKYHKPLFYSTSKINPEAVNRNDFSLEPLPGPETEFTLVMVGDPQCQTAKGVGYFTKQHDSYPGTIPDIQSTVNEGLASGDYRNVYAITLGDIVFDSSNMWDSMRDAMSNVQISTGWLPFFQCIGNHDHTATRSDDYQAAQLFIDHFGPTDYSFDRGNAHIVVMDDVYGTSTTSASYPDKKTWNYNGGFIPDQWEWLQQDLALVQDKENKIIIFCTHVPFREGAWVGGANIIWYCYRSEILTAMSEFHSAELMCGHSHYPACYIHKDFITRSGRPVMEHIHQAACGGWWNCHSSVTGGPNGYTVYKIKGADVVDWTNKGTGRSKDYQFRVYDGDQVYTGSKSYKYNWYADATGGKSSITAYGNENLKGCFVAEVWDDDDTWWTVEMYQDGKKVGDFTRLPDGSTSNMALASYAFNELGKDSASWTDRTHSHLWYYKPVTVSPSGFKNWEVVVTHTIPGSGLKRVFRRSDLTTGYSEF